ncbi:BamA/TamA family outer membrane protein [candidate division KSB1 bacterium]|nr:BamA/TamA family outer membrane protein [candidate division KSB1 bacterium]
MKSLARQKAFSLPAILVFGLCFYLLAGFNHLAFAQEKEDKEIPPEQLPVEERDTGDSFIENLGELPGDIITLPFKLFFKGVGFVMRVVDYNAITLRVTDWLTSEDEKTKVRPIFTPVSGGGLIFIQDDLFKKGMKFRASGSFGTRTRRNVYGGLRDPKFFSPKFGVEMAGFYSRLPDEDFFGIGNNTSEENETNYLHEENNLKVSLISLPSKGALFSAGLGYSNVHIKEGRDPNHPSLDSLFTPAQVPGFFGTEMWSLRFNFYRDTRNATGHPTKGGEEYLAYEFAKEINGDTFGYRKFTLDVRRYLHLFYDRVMAVRMRVEITDNLQNRQIPFYQLAGLGGPNSLRGYRPVRFRDKDLILAGVEYRWPLPTMAIAYGFFEEGRVFSNVFDEFSLHEFKYSFGGGLRLKSIDGGLIAIFEIAKSREQIRFNFGLNTDLRRF